MSSLIVCFFIVEYNDWLVPTIWVMDYNEDYILEVNFWVHKEQFATASAIGGKEIDFFNAMKWRVGQWDQLNSIKW